MKNSTTYPDRYSTADMEGTKLLTKLKDAVPKMRKIIITGYSTLQNAIEAVNKGADAYIIKPIDMEETLKVIREQLQKQAEEKKYSEQRKKITENSHFLLIR